MGFLHEQELNLRLRIENWSLGIKLYNNTIHDQAEGGLFMNMNELSYVLLHSVTTTFLLNNSDYIKLNI